MQLPTGVAVFNKKNVENILRRESKFISELLNKLPLPTTASDSDDGLLLEDSKDSQTRKVPPKALNKKTRAKSLVELQTRLEEISSRKRLNYKEKLLKKTIKTKIKRKGQQNQRNANRKLEHVKNELLNGNHATENKSEELSTAENFQPEDEGRMVFSKFDFSDIGKKKHKKEKHDPQKMLSDLQKQKETLNKLRESGEIEKAAIINEKSAWKNALAKAQGEKVKDDEQLLAKSIKKREQQRQRSKKKWDARQEGVKKMQEERQKKRQDNIDKRKKTKKVNKMKKAVKKGKVIPGF